MKLTGFKVLALDCYGTLIDWETGIVHAMKPLVERMGPAAPGRAELLQCFAVEETAQALETPSMPYSQLLAVVYKRLATHWGVDGSDEEATQFGASVPGWPAFADSAASLMYLKKFYKLVILSNVDRVSFEGSQSKLDIDFDAVYTAEEIQAYKPSRRNFDYMLERLHKQYGFEKGDVLVIAQSLFHDHEPANHMGLASAWIDRTFEDEGWGATPPPPEATKYDFYFKSMAALTIAHQEQLRAD